MTPTSDQTDRQQSPLYATEQEHDLHRAFLRQGAAHLPTYAESGGPKNMNPSLLLHPTKEPQQVPFSWHNGVYGDLFCILQLF